MNSADQMMMIVYVGTIIVFCGRDDLASLIGVFIAAVGIVALWGVRKSEGRQNARRR